MDLGLKSGIELMTPGLQDEKLHTTPPRHNFPILHTVKYLIKGLQTFHHAPPLHLHQASAMTERTKKKKKKERKERNVTETTKIVSVFKGL